jgi:hypothetical protein
LAERIFAIIFERLAIVESGLQIDVMRGLERSPSIILIEAIIVLPGSKIHSNAA